MTPSNEARDHPNRTPTAPTEAAALIALLLADPNPGAVSHRKEAAALIARQAEELEAVRKDAERYRWLQHQRCGNVCDSGGDSCYLDLNPRDLDAAIDSARSQGGGA